MGLQEQQAMACEKVTELLPEYILGQTSAEQDAELRAHFSTCAACAQALAEFAAVSARIAQAAPQVAPPTRLKAALMTRVAAAGAPVAQRVVQPKRSLSRLFTFARLGLAVMIGLLGLQSVRLWREAQTVAEEADRQRAAVVDISQNPRSVALSATADGGKSSGWMKFSPDAQTGVLTVANGTGGITVTGTLRGLTPGDHGIHIHTIGTCDAPAFTTAGGHWNPTTKMHGSQNPQGQHFGDMMNITAGADSTAKVQLTTKGGSLHGTDMLMDADGAAIVVHATADDYKTDPSGNSGARAACGVIMGS